MKKTVLSFLLTCLTLSAGEINIAVAANVSYAIDELKAEFAKTHPDTKVTVTLGSSGKLTAQIKNGAPYGLFMAANMKYPESLYNDKIATTKPVVYAQGALAYLSDTKQDFSKGIDLLTDKKIKKIAVANPKTAPYGKAAIEAMKNGNIYDKVEQKFVFAESISQTVTYAVTAADIGLIAKSSLYSSKMKQYKKGINWVAVDPKLYTPIKQGIVLLKDGNKNPEYKMFYDFILSKKAKDIFTSYGYIVE
ncbi:molybdate ABC transporter substrate-binding protein [Sulfurimonas marina]|uniref:Molybdate ABC transporter substrate-binding protein n=1 Tax=Sulfurimonas marina TaxID=2590551 RepID=A0A7M1AV05_9BACT|nr:molybdate ABC transporter substrate-binding protein [Sulfurimonas marina]QOP41263.1 molybdate ABC transporter substrate-binding protein [Sulfurimonas marina]